MGHGQQEERAVAVLSAALVAAGFLAPAPARAAVSRAELALRWAPIHYQDVDATGSHALGGKSDYLTKVDFDGNLTGRDNWHHAGQSTAAYVYYSAVETSTNWYFTIPGALSRTYTYNPYSGAAAALEQAAKTAPRVVD